MNVMDVLFKRAKMFCTICDAPAGSCQCWTRCACGWSYRTGEKCRNPDHGGSDGKIEIVSAALIKSGEAD